MSIIKKGVNAGEETETILSDDARYFLASILGSLEDSVVSVDFNSVITSWNKAAEKLYGYSAEEVIGKPLTMLTLPGDLRQVLSNIESVRRGERVKVYETVRFHKDGHQMHLSIKLSPVKNDKGEIIGVSTIARNISERKETENALRESGFRLDAALAVAKLGTFEWNIRTDEVVLDKRSCEIFGFAPGEGARAQEIFDRIAPLDLRRVQAEVQASIKTMSRLEIEYRIILPDGRTRTIVSINEFLSGADDGEVEKAFGVFSDVTRHKIADEALRQSEERLRMAVNISQISIFDIDLVTDAVQTDEIGRRIYGWAPDEALTFNRVQAHFHPADRDQVLENVARAFEPNGPGEFEIEQRIIRTDGETRWIRVHGRAFFEGESGARRAVRCIGTYIDITERRQFEEELRRQRDLTATITSSMGEGIYALDCDGRLTFMNPAAERKLGWKESELLGRDMHESIHFQKADGTRISADDCPLLEVLRSGRDVRNEDDVFTRKDGGIIFVSYISSPITTNGEVVGAVLTFRDITERKKAEAALRESQEVLRLAMSGSRMGAWSRDLATEDVYWSPELEAICGFPEGAFAGTIDGFYELVHEEDKERIRLEIRRAIDERQNYVVEFRFRHADGSIRWMEGRGQAVYSADGVATKVYGIGVDVTARKQAELNAEFLDLISQDLVRISAPREIVRSIGERLNAFLGISASAFLELNEAGDAVIINDDWRREDVPSLVGDYKLSDFVTEEFLQAAKSGQTIVIRDVKTDSRIADPPAWAELKIGAHINVPLVRNGEWKFSFCVYRREDYNWRGDEIELLRELSSRVWTRLERAFAEQEREGLLKREHAARVQAEEASRLKDDFLATVSHELRTPLNAILGWSKMLVSGTLGEEHFSRAAETIYRNAKAQAVLIEDILDVSRIITGKISLEAQPITLAPVIQLVTESLRPSIEAKSIRMQMRFDFESRQVCGDAPRLQQVVWNLLSNAIKFTPEKGQIEITLECGEAETKIIVSDTGRGISQEFLPFVFDRFRQADGSTTRNHGGLGLGLAIVRHIVELHGGRVEVFSDGEGQGTTFTVSLPLAETAPPVSGEEESGDDRGTKQSKAAEIQPEVCPSEIKGMRILLVDDEPDALELLAAVLVRNGAEVKTQTNARDALETAKSWKPDVIVSDIAMPEEDGYSFIRKLRDLPAEEGGAVPVVALTAYVGIKEKTKVLSSGFQMYVPKPVEPADLLSILASLVHKTA